MALTPDTNPNRADKLAARNAAEQGVLMREVDEAVRREQLEGAARRYGLLIGGAILIILLAFGGWLLWRERQESRLESRSEQLVLAFDELDGGSMPKADEELAPLATDDGDAASVAASLARAGIALRDNRRPEAVKIFQAVAENADAPEPYRQLAAIRLVAAQFEDLQPQAVIDRLKPMAVPGNPWFGSAGELVAMAYLKQNRPDLAGPLLAQISKDEGVPETLRSRTRQLAGLLGQDAIEDEEATLSALAREQGTAGGAGTQ